MINLDHSINGLNEKVKIEEEKKEKYQRIFCIESSGHAGQTGHSSYTFLGSLEAISGKDMENALVETGTREDGAVRIDSFYRIVKRQLQDAHPVISSRCPVE